MAKNPRRTMVFINAGVKHGFVVLRPGNATGGVFYGFVKEVSGICVAEVYGVKLSALGIGGIGEELMVGRMRDAAKLKKAVIVGKCVPIYKHAFLAAITQTAAIARMLTTLHITDVIGVRSIRGGNA